MDTLRITAVVHRPHTQTHTAAEAAATWYYFSQSASRIEAVGLSTFFNFFKYLEFCFHFKTKFVGFSQAVSKPIPFRESDQLVGLNLIKNWSSANTLLVER